MNSLKALLPAWILLILLVTLTEGISSNDTSSFIDLDDNQDDATNTTMPTNDLVKSPTNQQETPTPSNQPETPTPSNQTGTPPTYVIKSAVGNPCLLATFNITIRLSYYVKAAKNNRKYLAFKDIKVPDIDDTVNSVCGENQSTLALEWSNSTLSLNLTFLSHGKSKDSAHTNWTLDAIAFGYNLSNYLVFPGSSRGDYVTLEKDGLGLFNTEIGHTKECDSVIKARLAKGDMGTAIKFEYVKLAAFNLTSSTFPEETEECQVKTTSIRDEDIMVPLIIACALSFIIIVVVVAYAISRKVQEVRDQSQYKPMP